MGSILNWVALLQWKKAKNTNFLFLFKTKKKKEINTKVGLVFVPVNLCRMRRVAFCLGCPVVLYVYIMLYIAFSEPFLLHARGSHNQPPQPPKKKRFRFYSVWKL